MVVPPDDMIVGQKVLSNPPRHVYIISRITQKDAAHETSTRTRHSALIGRPAQARVQNEILLPGGGGIFLHDKLGSKADATIQSFERLSWSDRPTQL